MDALSGSARIKTTGPEPLGSRLSVTVHERGWQLELEADDPAKGEWGLRSFTVTVLDGGELVDDDGLRWIASSLPGLMAYFGQRAPLLGSDESKVAAVMSSGPDGEELVRVADVYLRAVKAGQRPVVAVQRALGLKQSTANRRVRAARDLGLLPPTGKESK